MIYKGKHGPDTALALNSPKPVRVLVTGNSMKMKSMARQDWAMNNPRQNGPDYAVSQLFQVWQKIEAVF